MKIAVVIGTRPEIIKMAPVIHELNKRKIAHFLIHTNQHYSKNMDADIFKCLNLEPSKYNLNVGSGSHGTQTGKMLDRIEGVLIKEKPDIVIVHGDTNTTIAGALAAKKLKITVGHVESGLRCYENIPEEVNRIIVDHIADIHFAPTEKSKEHLICEGISPEKIFVVGNTVVDALKSNLDIAEKNSSVIIRFELERKKYILVTAHRQENVDNKENLMNILNGISIIGKYAKIKIIYPVHPRTRKAIEIYKISVPKNITIIDPVDYHDFLVLENNAKLIITDSGGLQEEACVLGIPCVTIRTSTERPETIDVGANSLSGTDASNIVKHSKKMLIGDNSWDRTIFGDGHVAKKIVDILLSYRKS